MIKRTGQELDTLVREYLRLSGSIERKKRLQKHIKDQLEDEMQAREVEEIVSICGNVTRITRSASVSFPAKHVLNLAEVWQESTDPILKQCGSLLMNQKQERPASTYVRITAPKQGGGLDRRSQPQDE